MSSIGPQLPPQLLSKRRRSSDPDNDDDDDDGNINTPPKHPRRDSPKNTDEIALDASDSGSDADPDTGIGPQLPSAAPAPAPNADEIDIASPSSDSESHTGPSTAAPTNRPPSSPSSSSSSDEDDFGPSLPSASAPRRVAGPSMPAPPEDNTPRRDAWMLAPPPSSSTFSERDTTRIRARKFASKPSASSAASSAPGPSIWTETPEEKLKRLQDSVLGRVDGTAGGSGDQGAEQRRRAREQRDRDIAERIDAQRGRSLYEEHQRGGAGGKGGNGRRAGDGRGGEGKEPDGDDDPSKRAFDREKDMALGGKIGAAQRRELIKKSANFGGRFSKGSFL